MKKNKEAAPILKKIERPRSIIILDEAWGTIKPKDMQELAELTAICRPGRITPIMVTQEAIDAINKKNDDDKTKD